MCPWDWNALIKAVLSPAQYAVYRQDLKDACVTQAMRILGNNIPISLKQLIGVGPYAHPQQQAAVPMLGRQQLTEIIKTMEHKIPISGWGTGSFGNVRQGPPQPYMEFINPLQEAISRQIDDLEAAETLLLSLAVESANEDSTSVLRGIKVDKDQPSLHDSTGYKSAKMRGQNHIKHSCWPLPLKESPITPRLSAFRMEQRAIWKRIVRQVKLLLLAFALDAKTENTGQTNVNPNMTKKKIP